MADKRAAQYRWQESKRVEAACIRRARQNAACGKCEDDKRSMEHRFCPDMKPVTQNIQVESSRGVSAALE